VTVVSVALRQATETDARLLFDWVNAPDSLPQKEKTSSPIAWDHHCAWLRRRLRDPQTLLFIVELDRQPVGQIRLQPDDSGRHYVDIYLAEPARRQGIGRQALLDAVSRARTTVNARVKASNLASCRLFESAGFIRVGRDGDDLVVYTRSRDEPESP
jgi:UDP-2,4-diacetamido-2,4,6-trideoxy-beta-L-altropyranose hydrolase